MNVKLLGFTIFILFFGAAALDAIQTRNWLRSAFWLLLGIVFVVADNLRKPTPGTKSK